MNSSNFEVLAYEETVLGILCLRRRKLLQAPETSITEMTLNHEFLMSSFNTDSECALSKIALEMHEGKNLQVLVGGLGLGYTAHEALQSERVQKLTVMEFLPQVIQWLREGLVPLSSELNSDQRLEIIQGDFYGRMAEPSAERFDLILVDVDHSPHEHLTLERKGNDAFYTEAGLQQAKGHLRPGGILAVWSYAESSPFADALHNVFPKVRIEKIEFENTLTDEKHTDWLFFASEKEE